MTKKKKMLFIATSPLYLEKGSSLRMYAILKILSECYKIDVVTYSLGRKFNLRNVHIYRTTKWFKPRLPIGQPTAPKAILDFLIFLKSIRLSLFNKYDVIHCEDFESLGIGCAIKLFYKKPRLVYNLHNRILDTLHLKREKSRFDLIYLKLEKFFVNQTEKVILNWAKYLNDDTFSNKKKFLYYDPIETRIEKSRLPAENYLIYSGNFEEYQGLQNFIPVFTRIKHDIKLVLVGNPSTKIKKLIKDLNAEDRILLTGRLPVAQSNYLIKNALAGVLPRIEGSSMKLIHYFLWNKPAIATNTESNRELIKDGVNGFLYSSESELIEKIKKIVFDTEIIEGFSEEIENTKNKILDIWSKERFITEYTK